jgi:hypothetical protein
MIAWKIARTPLQPANAWRRIVLPSFGARIEGWPFLHQRSHPAVLRNREPGDRVDVGVRMNLNAINRIVLRVGGAPPQEGRFNCRTHHSLCVARAAVANGDDYDGRAGVFRSAGIFSAWREGRRGRRLDEGNACGSGGERQPGAMNRSGGSR